MAVHFFLCLFLGVASTTMGSTVKPTADLNLEETVRQLSAKMVEMEMESRNWRNDLSSKLQELEQRTSEQIDDVKERITNVEMLSNQSTKSVAEKLQNAESKFTKTDNHLLFEVLQLKPVLKDTVEKVRSVEEQVTSAMEKERLKTHSLQVQMTEVNAELHSVDIIQKNVSLTAENLRLQLNDSLSNLTRNMRIFENSSLNFLKDCANSSSVSKFDENLKSLEKNAKQELDTLRSELSPRLQELEERSGLSDDVLEMKKTLTNHSSLLSRLSQQLWELESLHTCDSEPPSTPNGKPLKFDRKQKSIVQYECDQDFFMIGNSTVLYMNGKWEGHPPICSFFDTTFTLVANLRNNHSITCYSGRYSKNIVFSRVVDTGTGGGLPTAIEQEVPVLNFTGKLLSEMTGAHECRFRVDNRSASIAVPLELHGGFLFKYQSRFANIAKTVELVAIVSRSYISSSSLRWRHNGVLVPAWNGLRKVEISGVQPADAGIYECYKDGDRLSRQALFRLIIRKCEKNRYGGNCKQQCPACYNGGTCHDLLGVCICPAGFTGNNCEFACSENQFSGDCANVCLRDDCKYKLFCKPDPYGCSCFPGLRGYWCSALEYLKIYFSARAAIL